MILAVTARPVHAAPSPPRMCRRTTYAAVAVASGKRFRRRRRPSTAENDTGASAEEATQNVSRAELEFLAALASEPAPQKQSGQARSSGPPPPSSASDAGRVTPLRGLDVLQALQHKAAAGSRKGVVAGGGKGGKGHRRSALGTGGGGQGDLDGRDYSNVRPLEIKSDWGSRLDVLDKLIQELEAQQHYSDGKPEKTALW